MNDLDVIEDGEYAGLTPAEVRLAELMSDVSEECYCAGWMHDTEFDVWRLVVAGGGWGMGNAESIDGLPEIRSLAEEIDRWIIWNDDESADGYYLAIPLAEWRERYADRATRRAGGGA